MVIPPYVQRHSFIELDARARAQSLMDPGSWRELVGPFNRIESPWLPEQGIAPQSDDGCVVLKGKIAGSQGAAGSRQGDHRAGAQVSGHHLPDAEEQVGIRRLPQLRPGGGVMKTLWSPPPGTLFLVPAAPSVSRLSRSRTVLGGKGSLRRGPKRRALASCAPFCINITHDGRLRREPKTKQLLRLTKDENQVVVDKTS